MTRGLRAVTRAPVREALPRALRSRVLPPRVPSLTRLGRGSVAPRVEVEIN